MMFDIRIPDIKANNVFELQSQINTVLQILSDGIGDALNEINTDNISNELLAKFKSVGVDITLEPNRLKSHFISFVVGTEEFTSAVENIISQRIGG